MFRESNLKLHSGQWSTSMMIWSTSCIALNCFGWLLEGYLRVQREALWRKYCSVVFFFCPIHHPTQHWNAKYIEKYQYSSVCQVPHKIYSSLRLTKRNPLLPKWLFHFQLLMLPYFSNPDCSLQWHSCQCLIGLACGVIPKTVWHGESSCTMEGGIFLFFLFLGSGWCFSTRRETAQPVQENRSLVINLKQLKR